MGTKMIRVSFDVELAKKITNGDAEGRIVTRNGESARIVCFDRKDEFRPIIALVNSGDIEIPYAFCVNGKFVNDGVLDTHDLMLEIPEYMTFKNYDFKPFDKVLARDNGGIWVCSLFSHISNSQKRCKYITVAGSFENCIPYNEQTAHLLGTTENYE